MIEDAIPVPPPLWIKRMFTLPLSLVFSTKIAGADAASERTAPGVDVPMPILEFKLSIEKIDAAVGEVANENAFIADGIVLVADFWNASVSDAAEEEAKVMTFESR